MARPLGGATLHPEEGIMKDASSGPVLVSRYLKRSMASFGKWFNSIPNLAASGETSLPRKVKPVVTKILEAGLDYHDLLLKLQGKQYGNLPEGERPASVQQLEEAVNRIVAEGKKNMASAHSREELLLGFMDGIYKIKTLL